MKGNSLVMWVYLSVPLEILFFFFFYISWACPVWTMTHLKSNIEKFWLLVPIPYAQNWVGKFPQKGTSCHLILGFLEA